MHYQLILQFCLAVKIKFKCSWKYMPRYLKAMVITITLVKQENGRQTIVDDFCLYGIYH